MTRKIMVWFRGEHRQIEVTTSRPDAMAPELKWNFVDMNEADFEALHLTDNEELTIFNVILAHEDEGAWR